jgi:hypothetical protein
MDDYISRCAAAFCNISRHAAAICTTNCFSTCDTTLQNMLHNTVYFNWLCSTPCTTLVLQVSRRPHARSPHL